MMSNLPGAFHEGYTAAYDYELPQGMSWSRGGIMDTALAAARGYAAQRYKPLATLVDPHTYAQIVEAYVNGFTSYCLEKSRRLYGVTM